MNFWWSLIYIFMYTDTYPWGVGGPPGTLCNRILISVMCQLQNASHMVMAPFTCSWREQREIFLGVYFKPQRYLRNFYLCRKEAESPRQVSFPSLGLKGGRGSIVFKQLKARWSEITTVWQCNFNKFCFFFPGTEIHQIVAWSNRRMIRKETSAETWTVTIVGALKIIWLWELFTLLLFPNASLT